MDELEQALAAHRQVCRIYPRQGQGEQAFLTPATAAVEPAA
jgi:hypothetical protein